MIDRAKLENAFEAMGRALAQRGKLGEIAVYGGSCLMLVSDFRQSTDDVDAVFLAEPRIMSEIAETVGRAAGLPSGWLNQAVKIFAPPRDQPAPNLFPYGEYPRQEIVGLRVFVPAPEYLLAMKIVANRAVEDIDKQQADAEDALNLMLLTGRTRYEDLAELVRSCYPRIPGLTEGRIAPRLKARMNSLVDALDARDSRAPPAWNAPRGAPTREG
jgi:ribosomal protein S30